MSINKSKYFNQVVFFILGLFIVISFESCNTQDDMAPVITLIGNDSIDNHPLNQEYVDAGATALDETDGDMTTSIFVENTVNEDYVGWYSVVYNCVDKAGNSAIPVTRSVKVINYSWGYASPTYNALETQGPPGNDTCTYVMNFSASLEVNNRMIFTSFACDPDITAYADIDGTLIVIPFQTFEDSIRRISFQGAGSINDTMIYINYTRYTDTLTSYWNATFVR